MKKYTVIVKTITGVELGTHHYNTKAEELKDVCEWVSNGCQVEVMKATVYYHERYLLGGAKQ